jgi:putative transposase
MPARDTGFAQDGFYHIYNRGAGHQVIFREDENYLFVLRQVKKYSRELNVAVVAYCLLPNHYHFLLRQDGQQSAGLLPQWVFNSYTKAYNKRYERTGTLLEGRYKAIPVDKEAYLLHLCRYIHANPMRHGLASQLEEWPYSNYPEWMGLRDGALVDRAFVQAYFPTAQEYGQFVWKYALGQDELPAELQSYLRTLDA